MSMHHPVVNGLVSPIWIIPTGANTLLEQAGLVADLTGIDPVRFWNIQPGKENCESTVYQRYCLYDRHHHYIGATKKNDWRPGNP